MSKLTASTRLAALMNALADHTEHASDADILGDVPHGRDERKAAATAVRSILQGAIKTFRSERRRKAAEEHVLAVGRLAAHRAKLPASTADRRALLGSVVGKRPQMPEGMTLQFRNFASLSDADVESALKQLDALGMLQDDEGSDQDGEP